jgi:recombination associated protein RdgC
MFKNLLIFRIAPGAELELLAAEAALQTQRFSPCAPSQAQASGWVEPRGAQHGPLIESVGGQWLLALKTEAKLLPSSVVKRRAQEIAEQLEHSTGRKPGRKQLKDLQEQASLELLPQAFTREGLIRLWLDPQARWLMLDCASAKRAEEAITLLLKALPGLALAPVQTQLAPATAMAHWLLGEELPAAFSIDRDCELKAADEMKAAVRYARHALDIEEVRGHIQAGKQPTRLALTWRGRLSFVLTESWQIKRLAFDDVVFESTRGAGASPEESFDADVAITTGELREWLVDVLEALGGELAAGAMPTELASARVVAQPPAVAPSATPAAMPAAAPVPATLADAPEPPPWD